MFNYLPTLRWLHGLVAAFVGGGAGAVTASITASALAPDKFNTGSQLHALLLLMAMTFTANGLLSASFYLAKAPLPFWDGVDRRNVPGGE